MQESREPHNIVTALDISLADTEVHVVGRCIVHTAVFQDIGLVWPTKRQRTGAGQQHAAGLDEGHVHVHEPAGLEMRDVAELKALGLPVQFGTSKQRSTPFEYMSGMDTEVAADQPGDPAAAAVVAEAAAAAESTGAEAGGLCAAPAGPDGAEGDPLAALVNPYSEWQQAYDAASGYWYYYNARQQLTQWEPPGEGFRPAGAQEYWPAADSGGSAEPAVGAVQAAAAAAAAAEGGAADGEAAAGNTLTGMGEVGGAGHFRVPDASGSEQVAEDLQELVGPAAEPACPPAAQQSSDSVGAAQEGSVFEHRQQQPGQKGQPKPRMESTGLLDGIPQPQGTHLRFDSSSSEEAERERPPPAVRACAPEPAATAEVATPAVAELSSPAACSPGAQAEPDVEQLASDMEGLSVEAEDAGAAGDNGGASGHSDSRQGGKSRPRRSKHKKGFHAAAAPAASQAKDQQLRAGCVPGDLPRQLQKYWLQRYSIFSRFDEGIRVDSEGWYSATPEVIARHHAVRAAAAASRVLAAVGADCVAVDPFAGVGGNVIQLAAVCKRVIAVEIDPERMQILKTNAQVYGVAHKIDFLCGDFFRLAPSLRADVVFYSPPWGGPQYAHQAVYDIEPMGGQRFGLPQLLHLAFKQLKAKGVIAFMPRNTDLRQLSATLPAGQPFCEVERAVLNGIFKGISIYYGCLARDPRLSDPQLLQQEQAGGGASSEHEQVTAGQRNTSCTLQ